MPGRGRPLFLIDLGVPRNVEPTAAQVADVYLYDVDALQDVMDANRRARQREAERARAMVADAVARLARAAAAQAAAPLVRALRAKLEAIRRAEVARAATRFRDAPPEARAVLEAMSHAFLNKVLHGPTERLRAAQVRPGAAQVGRLVRDLFGLTDGVEAHEVAEEGWGS
jgi:glutamyl-tRNA reductase